MSVDAAELDLDARIEALRRQLAGVVIMLSNAGERLEDLADELRSRRQAKVVALDRRRRNKGGRDPEI